MDPEVLLLDEPTDALDPRSQSQLIDLLIGWGGSGKSVITATHHLGLLEDDRRPLLRARRRAAWWPTVRRPTCSPTRICSSGPTSCTRTATAMARASRTRTRTSTGTTTSAPGRSRAHAEHALSRIGVAIDADLLAQFDARIDERGYGSRSEAFRDLIRDALISAAAEVDESPAVGTITLVYDHHERTRTRGSRRSSTPSTMRCSPRSTCTSTTTTVWRSWWCAGRPESSAASPTRSSA